MAFEYIVIELKGESAMYGYEKIWDNDYIFLQRK